MQLKLAKLRIDFGNCHTTLVVAGGRFWHIKATTHVAVRPNKAKGRLGMAESAHYGVAMDDRLRGLNIQRRAGLQRLHRVRVLPSELRKTVVQEREASQRPVLQCGFNWWMQHTRSCVSRRSVADEIQDPDQLLGEPEGPDVGPLAEGG
jgi:hypothetical protein